jgi:hypothetical protein
MAKGRRYVRLFGIKKISRLELLIFKKAISGFAEIREHTLSNEAA